MQRINTFKLGYALLRQVMRGQRTINRHFATYTQQERNEAIRSWAAEMIRLAGIELRVRDLRSEQEQQTANAEGALVVCNHISWLDIFVIDAWQAATFVSKSEVAKWPVIGSLVTSAGTLYIQREKRRDAHKLVGDIANALTEGKHVAIFPEGTTSDGFNLRHFHANLLQAAVSSQRPVQPLTLKFTDSRTGARTRDAAYIDDMTLIDSLSLLANYAKRHEGAHIVAELTILPMQRGSERRALSAELRHAMSVALGVNEVDPLVEPHVHATRSDDA